MRFSVVVDLLYLWSWEAVLGPHIRTILTGYLGSWVQFTYWIHFLWAQSMQPREEENLIKERKCD